MKSLLALILVVGFSTLAVAEGAEPVGSAPDATAVTQPAPTLVKKHFKKKKKKKSGGRHAHGE